MCTVNEICANTQDLCERSDLLAPFERLQASQSHRLTPLHRAVSFRSLKVLKGQSMDVKYVTFSGMKSRYSVLANIDPDA